MTAIYVLVQARLGSTRLPRKILMNIEGKTMLERVVERAQQIGPPVALVIPEHDVELHAYAIEHGWPCFLGSEEDVLGRYAQAALALKADHVVRVTADCPFLSVEWAQVTLAEHLHGGYDLTWDEAEGRGVQVFSVEALLRADREATPAFRHSPDVWMIHSELLHDGRFSVHRIRASVDTSDDLETARVRAKEVDVWPT